MDVESSDHIGMLRQMLAALDADADAPPGALRVEGRAGLASRYPVSGLACAAIGSAALMLARWARPGDPPSVLLDRALASWWFGYSIRPQGWKRPDVRDAVTGDYAARDGWIRLHANAAHHRHRALAALGLPDDAARAAVAERIRGESAEALEAAIVERGGCAAALRPPAAWRDHPQGRAVAAEPLVHRLPGSAAAPDGGGVNGGGAAGGGTASGGTTFDGMHAPDPRRPLAGIRVLDLTRVLAGPAATRFLAAYGAQVLRLDPADWDEPGMVPEVTVGKRCAFLDLRSPAGRDRFRRLLAGADVLVHGYRPGALDALGLDAETRQALRPGLVDVCLDAWGWTGPWRGRRGFDSLVQMSAGIAWAGEDAAPDPLPVQALDQSAGYLMAACALRGLALRRETGRGGGWRVSLARMARLLQEAADAAPGAPAQDAPALGPAPDAAYDPAIEPTAWGPAQRLRAPCRVAGARWGWDLPAGPLRSGPPDWG
ncbi:CoA transferase [Castellaniella defragrans]|uniref:Crotonobetainyl-CoA:carnitine CoA-transferase CaiB-like acyl-CoA transferase n=2 Tax=Castellaniella defragrans TaxID=75697 RepID=A0A7W9TKS0_CASDE|nr:CoA transferase [Castellaniella defragrans]MBB6082211.1 crotonobetainyl-CoA:carnitine CoA-transferase CaiB-like acyl-CoA transferase [Castellaniella defragrans]